MKKKFINGLLMAAMFIGVTSSMVSCKDYDDSKVYDLQQILADKNQNLLDLLAQQRRDLNTRIDSLKAVSDACKASCNTFQTVTLPAMLNEYAKISWVQSNYYDKGTIDQKFINELANYYTKTEIDDMLKGYYTKDQIDASLKHKMDSLAGVIQDVRSAIPDQKAIADMLGGAVNDLQTALNNYFVTHLGDIIEQYETINNTTIGGVDTTWVKNYVATTIKDSLTLIHNQLFLNEQATILAKQVADEALAIAKDNRDKLTALSSQVTTNKDSIYILNNLVNTINNAITTLGNEVAALDGKVTALDGKVTTIDGKVTTIEGQVTTLNSTVELLDQKLAAVRDSAAAAKALADANSARIDALEAVDQQILAQIADLNLTDDSLARRIDSLAQVTNDLKEGIVKDSILAVTLFNQVDSVLNAVKDSINGEIDGIKAKLLQHDTLIANNTAAISALRSEYETFAQQVSDKLKDLQKQINEAKADIQKNKEAIEKLQGEVEKIKNSMAKFITGIEINGTHNPVFGELNTPFGVRSNVLAAYHGAIPSEGLQFPTRRQAYYALSDEYTVITNEDIAMIGDLKNVEGYLDMDQQFIVAGLDPVTNKVAKGNAGILFLTVNPTNRDFTGTEFSLINSQDEESPVKLEPIGKTDHVLTAGYTRASINNDAQSSNGFYAAQATISKEAAMNARTRLNVDLSAAKDVVKDVKNFRNGINVTEIATTIYKNVNELIELDAVKAAWTDEATGKDMAVVSQYDIAAATIKPLSFAFLKDYQFDGVPGLNRVERFVDKLIDRVVKRVKVNIPSWESLGIHVEALVLDDFSLLTLNKDLTGKANITVSFDKDVNVSLGTLTVDPITVTVPAAKVWVEGEEVKSYLTNSDGKYVIDEDGDGKDSAGDSYVDPETVKVISGGIAYLDDNKTTKAGTTGKLIQIGVTVVEGKWVDTPSQTVTVDNVTVDANNKTVHLTFTIDVDMKDELQELYDDLDSVMNSANTKIDKMRTDINTYIADVVGQINNVKNQYTNLTGKVGKVGDYVKNLIAEYVDKVNARVGKYMTPNKYLQPFIVGRVGGNQYFRLTQSYNKPATIETENFEIALTTYNAETVCPAYKKFVAVTNVMKDGKSAKGGDATCKSVLDAANGQENFKKVIDGGYGPFMAFQGKKGYTYEILYSAVDYDGKVVAEKFYVKVAE